MERTNSQLDAVIIGGGFAGVSGEVITHGEWVTAASRRLTCTPTAR
jgi:hypothetical protein